MPEKLCPKCGITKQASSFYVSKKRPDGLSSYCRECQVRDSKSRYSPHPRWRAPEGHKWCPRCKSVLPIENFGKNKNSYDGLQTSCKPCAIAAVTASRHKDPTSHRQSSKNWRVKNVDRHADNNAKWKYGVEYGTYAKMFEEQGGVCAICGNPSKDGRRLCIDHCHDTRKVRALLCGPCNTGIGQLQHSKELLLKAIAYLDSHT